MLDVTRVIGYTQLIMPITKQAIKKLRHDRKRTKMNASRLVKMRTAVKNARKKPTSKSVSEAFKVLDKSVKMGLIHKNKASRLKSRISKTK